MRFPRSFIQQRLQPLDSAFFKEGAAIGQKDGSAISDDSGDDGGLEVFEDCNLLDGRSGPAAGQAPGHAK